MTPNKSHVLTIRITILLLIATSCGDGNRQISTVETVEKEAIVYTNTPQFICPEYGSFLKTPLLVSLDSLKSYIACFEIKKNHGIGSVFYTVNALDHNDKFSVIEDHMVKNLGLGNEGFTLNHRYFSAVYDSIIKEGDYGKNTRIMKLLLYSVVKTTPSMYEDKSYKSLMGKLKKIAVDNPEKCKDNLLRLFLMSEVELSGLIKLYEDENYIKNLNKEELYDAFYTIVYFSGNFDKTSYFKYKKIEKLIGSAIN